MGLAVMTGLLLFNDRSTFHQAVNREAANLFGAKGDAYQATLDLAQKGGYTPTGFNAFGLGPTLFVVPWLMFYLLWPN